MKEYKLSKLTGKWCISFQDREILRIRKVFKDQIMAHKFLQNEFGSDSAQQFLKNKEFNWIAL